MEKWKGGGDCTPEKVDKMLPLEGRNTGVEIRE